MWWTPLIFFTANENVEYLNNFDMWILIMYTIGSILVDWYITVGTMYKLNNFENIVKNTE